jgi:hypothetical protein
MPQTLLTATEATHDDVRKLHPLLSLLDETTPEGSPLDEIKRILGAILTALKHQQETQERHGQMIATIGRRLAASGNEPRR